MQDAIVGFTLWPELKTQTNPAMALIGALVVKYFDGVGKCKETCRFNSVWQALCQQNIFMIKHPDQTFLTNIPVAHAIYSVAELHIVSRHGFRYCPARTANLKKISRHFLASADF